MLLQIQHNYFLVQNNTCTIFNESPSRLIWWRMNVFRQTHVTFYARFVALLYFFFLCKYIFRIFFIHSDILKQTEISMITCINSTTLKSHNVCFSVTLIRKGIFNCQSFYTIISSLLYLTIRFPRLFPNTYKNEHILVFYP